MAIYISFIDKSLYFYLKENEKIKLLKKVAKNFNQSELERDELEGEGDEQELSFSGESVNKELKNGKNYNLNVSEKALNEIEQKEHDYFRWKLTELQESNLDEFIQKFLGFELELPEELISQIKSEKQFLILPDEIVAFDTITVPSLSPWKVIQALNLKLSLNYKDIDSYSKKYKLISKVKPNSIYAIQVSKSQIAKSFSDYFSKLGIKLAGVSFYSSLLGSFYSTHIRGAKQGSIIVKVSEKQTTILAIIHGFVVMTETLHAGESEIYKNSTYHYGEYSRRSLSHKFVCYSVSKIVGNGESKQKSDEVITREQIEKSYSKNRTNPLAGNFQFRSLGVAELIRKKIDDMILCIEKSELAVKIDRVFVDIGSDQAFAKLKLASAIKVSFAERDIFKTIKTREVFKFKTFSPIFTKKGFSWSDLWRKKDKEE